MKCPSCNIDIDYDLLEAEWQKQESDWSDFDIKCFNCDVMLEAIIDEIYNGEDEWPAIVELQIKKQ